MSYLILNGKAYRTSGDRFAPVIYSKKERCIGTWFDGRPLYEKTLEITMADMHIYGGSYYEYNLENAVTANDKIVLIDGAGVSSNYKVCPVGSRTIYDDSGNYWELALHYQSIVVTCSRGTSIISNHIDPTLYIRVRYYKTSDAPGTGLWNLLGVPMIQYSAQEQCIGRWKDGKDLFRKTKEYAITSTIGTEIRQMFSEPGITPISITGYFKNTNDGRVYPIPYVNGTATATFMYNEYGYICIRVANDTWGTNYKIVVTYDYTKD